MNNKLTRGMIIKNYKELCEIMGWTVTNGRTKKSQLEKLNNFCTYHKDGNKFIIDKVYNKPQEKLNSGLFIEDIELLVLNMLAKANGRQVQLTTKNLYEELALVNHNYVENYSYDNNYKALEYRLKVNQETIKDVFFIINQKNKRNVTRALKNLMDKALIISEQVMCVCITDTKSNQDIYRQATKSEKETILRAEREVMKQMHISKKSYFDIPANTEKRKIFNKNVSNLLKEENIDFYYYSYLITYNKDDVLEELGRVREAEVKNRLNAKVLNAVNEQIDKNGAKVKEQYKDIIGCLPPSATDIDKERYNKTYEKEAKKVAKVVVDRKSRVKVEQIEDEK